MERSAYQAMASSQADHWWFVARRKVLERVIARLSLPFRPSIIEVGCGPGGNLAMLQGIGEVKGVEYDEHACHQARLLSSAPVAQGSLPNQLPYPGERFDLICLFDVLEHIEHDEAALRALLDRAHPGSRCVLTVPAYQWLFSDHDAVHHHFRRYSRRQLVEVARRAGWLPERCGYFNALLFPVAAVARLVSRVVSRTNAHDTTALPRPWVNRMLAFVFGLEAAVVPRWLFPFGLSVLIVLRPGASAAIR